MFFASGFEKRMKDLAQRSGLKVADLSSRSGKLIFNIHGHRQPLLVLPFDGVWEFSCPSVIADSDMDIIPKPVLQFVLERNSTVKRGFWCIREIGGESVLVYMHNIPQQLLTPEEFHSICWGVVKEVEQLENAFRELFLRAA